MNRFKSTILAYTEDNEAYCDSKEYLQEDSIVDSKEFNQRVIYVDKSIKDKNLLNFEVIKLSSPFWFDDGEKYVTVTQNNYKDFDFDKILNDRTDKYDIWD